MKARSFFSFVLLLFAHAATAQQYVGNVQGAYIKEGNKFHITTTNSKVIIEFCTPSMFRVRHSWTGQFEANEPWMVTKYRWPLVMVQTLNAEEFFQFTTSDLILRINKTPFSLTVFEKSGRFITNDVRGMYKNRDTVGVAKSLEADEHFFGFGERMDFLDQRHKKLTLDVGRGKGRPHIIGAYNVLEANYSPIPFFMSTRGYGIFFHTAYPTHWDMGHSSNEEYSFKAPGGELDYYFIYGPKFHNILGQYTALTGRAPLLPRFALGLHVGTYSGGTWNYEHLTSDTYVIELARKLRALGIPVDILWLDSTWRLFGENGGKGATSFEWRETFQDPKGMFDSLYAMNFSMVGLHLRPRFDNGNTLKLLDTARQLGYTYPEGDAPGEFVNFFDTNSVNWWWEHGVMRLASIGAKFVKTDEGSAFGALANESDKTGPTGKDIAKLHNLFPLAYAKAPFEKFQAYNGIRGLNHTREGYAGIQRYPFIFAGDWPSEWQYFEPVIKAGLNIGISGVGYWTHCMGGFEHNADPELYMRWCQFGMLSPIAMVFGMDHPGYKEPWNYGEEALRNFIKYDSLRYTLIPYLYSSAWQQFKTGLPLMRALVLDYQDDGNVYNISDQYLLGDALMVCPVVTKGAQTRVVYLPKGKWYDFYTNEVYEGGKHYNIVTPVDHLPLFVKAGSVIPRQPVMQYVDEKQPDIITLDIYPGGEGRFVFYQDDGKSLDYLDGNYLETAIQVSNTERGLSVKVHAPQGKFSAAVTRYLLKIHAPAAPSRVREFGQLLNNGAKTDIEEKRAGWYYDEEEKLLYIVPAGGNYREINVTVEF
mgnify:FL=1|jgi:alpha-glucosidase